MKQTIKRTIGLLFALAVLITGIPFTEAQAAARPVIQINGVTVSGTSGTMEKGEKIKLTARSGKKNITKKCTWKSSRKNVAAVSKKGVLSAKKAGTTNITVKYKGKTSKKLKVVVLKQQKEPEKPTEPEDPSEPGTEPEQPSVSGSHTITYNINSKDKKDKLNGDATQSVSGEILQFSATVTPADGKKFLGWYDAPTGGNRIYETYKPSKNMTLYAHYTDKNVQKITFSLGCNYGDTYSFIGNGDSHDMEYGWTDKEYYQGAMQYGDYGNVAWKHSYTVDPAKKTFAVDQLPVPEVPGYTFAGWYTQPQDRKYKDSVMDSSKKIDSNTDVNTSVTRLYARFTKKMTVSFDDLRGGRYDDIVIDTYQSFKDAGKRLPKPNVEGVIFLGWAIDPDHDEDMAENPRLLDNGIITDDSYFFNCIKWNGYACAGCSGVSKYYRNAGIYDEDGCKVGFSDTIFPFYQVFEETDHITLYPVYHCPTAQLSFDPNGGSFLYNAEENWRLVYDDDIDTIGYNHKCTASYRRDFWAGLPYDEAILPGHESEPQAKWHWSYGNTERIMPKVTRWNYVFDKWVYKDKDGVEREFTGTTILTEDMIVYAKWNPGVCRVAYDTSGGVISDTEANRVGLKDKRYYSVTTETTLAKDGKQMPVPVSPKGRKFEGWFTSDGDPFNENTQILGDIVLFAHWGVLPEELPVTLKFNAGGGTFVDKGSDGTEVNLKSKTVKRSEKIGQFPELEDRPDYDFLGWYVVKPNETEPYTDASYLKKADSNARVETSMINDQGEILIVARWAAVEHVTDMTMMTVTENGVTSVDRDNNLFKIEYNGKDASTGLGFGAIVLSQSVRNEFRNVRWSSSRPDIIYIDGNDTIYSPNYFDSFKFGDNLGDVVLTATSLDNPNVKFDIHVTVIKK